MLYQSCFASFPKEIKLKIALTGLRDANSANEKYKVSAIAWDRGDHNNIISLPALIHPISKSSNTLCWTVSKQSPCASSLTQWLAGSSIWLLLCCFCLGSSSKTAFTIPRSAARLRQNIALNVSWNFSCSLLMPSWLFCLSMHHEKQQIGNRPWWTLSPASGSQWAPQGPRWDSHTWLLTGLGQSGTHNLATLGIKKAQCPSTTKQFIPWSTT